jgi:hypothetical protein
MIGEGGLKKNRKERGHSPYLRIPPHINHRLLINPLNSLNQNPPPSLLPAKRTRDARLRSIQINHQRIALLPPQIPLPPPQRVPLRRRPRRQLGQIKVTRDLARDGDLVLRDEGQLGARGFAVEFEAFEVLAQFPGDGFGLDVGWGELTDVFLRDDLGELGFEFFEEFP